MFKPLEKIVLVRGLSRENGRIVGVKQHSNGEHTLMIELVRKDFAPHVFGSKLIRVTPHDLKSKQVSIERHELLNQLENV